MEIPLSLEENFVAWHKTKSFTFSVRSAYYSECASSTMVEFKEEMARVLRPKIPFRKSYGN
jgi:hypothetical protein